MRQVLGGEIGRQLIPVGSAVCGGRLGTAVAGHGWLLRTRKNVELVGVSGVSCTPIGAPGQTTVSAAATSFSAARISRWSWFPLTINVP
jgi:hypothetical protein